MCGEDEREAKSPSFFNTAEIEVVVQYLQKLLQSQGRRGCPTISPKEIGIISPYRKQVQAEGRGMGEPGCLNLPSSSTAAHPLPSPGGEDPPCHHLQGPCAEGAARHWAAEGTRGAPHIAGGGDGVPAPLTTQLPHPRWVL